MALKDVMHDIEGYQDIQKEIEVVRRYGPDYTTQKGRVQQIINMLHPKTLRFTVSEIREETTSTKTLRLNSEMDHLPPFQAGQYINLCVEIGGIKTSRPYSISSPPNQTAYYDITVRTVPNGFVSEYLLHDVQPGVVFESTGPSGNFYHNPLFHGDDLVFLAGGSGITPFMSMIREITDKGLPRHIHLVYGSQHPEDVIFHTELSERARMHENITYSLVISDPHRGYHGHTGFLTADLLEDLVPDISTKMVYLCGPELMYPFCLRELKKLGVPRKRIRTEVFGPPKDVTAEPGWPEGKRSEARFKVTVRGRKTIAAQENEPLMIALERAGIVIPASCRSGECSLCRTRLVSGRVFQPSGVKIRRSDAQYGYIHPCMAYPISDIEIVL